MCEAYKEKEKDKLDQKAGDLVVLTETHRPKVCLRARLYVCVCACVCVCVLLRARMCVYMCPPVCGHRFVIVGRLCYYYPGK